MGSGSEEVEEIRRQIDETREKLGDSVAALAYKADVKNRGKEAIEDKKEVVMEKVDELRSKASGAGDGEGGIGESVRSKLPDGGAIKEKLPDSEAMRSKLPDGVGDAAGRLGDATPSKEDVRQKAQDAAETASGKPAAVVAGAAAAGLAAGLALPETELEREKIGPAAQDARRQAQSKVQDTVEQVKGAVRDAAESVAGAVREQGREQDGKVGEMAEKAADKTHEQVGRSS